LLTKNGTSTSAKYFLLITYGGSSEPYEINLQNGDVISITVKRPQFLLTKLKKRTEYLYSLGGSIEDYTVDKLVNTIFAVFCGFAVFHLYVSSRYNI
jgi:hypothetical protein